MRHAIRWVTIAGIWTMAAYLWLPIVRAGEAEGSDVTAAVLGGLTGFLAVFLFMVSLAVIRWTSRVPWFRRDMKSIARWIAL